MKKMTVVEDFCRWRLKKAGVRLERLAARMAKAWDEIEKARTNNPDSLPWLHDRRLYLEIDIKSAANTKAFWAWMLGPPHA